MQFAKKATLLAALAVVGTPSLMLIDGALAVEAGGRVNPNHNPTHTNGSAGQDSPPSPDSVVFGSRKFFIPFTVDDAGSQTIEVQLFVSRGPTDAWRMIGAKRPSTDGERQFEFTADADGEFWFATRTVDTGGPTQLASTVSPQLKVFIDTSKPHTELIAEADAEGRVDVQLVVRDQTPLQSMQLRYVTDTVIAWQDVDVSRLPADGRVSFTPSAPWQQLSLQLIAIDKANNQSVANRLVRLPRIAEAPVHRYAAIPGGGPDARQTPYRLSESDGVEARSVSGPVIKLDRNKNVTASPVINAFGNFRGASMPATTRPPARLAQQPSGTAPELIPPPEPTSMLDDGLPSLQGNSERRPPFDAPSIYATPAPTPSAADSTGELPPPASMEQISNGFKLTPPASTPDSTGPETIATPPGAVDSQAANSATEASPKPRLRRTLSEAMRPLNEQSALPSQTDSQASESKAAESKALGARQTSDPSYQSARPNPADRSTLLSRVPLRFSDSLRFSLAYELEAVGSQGVEAIELYGSTDEGRTWKLWGRDPDRTSPFDIETREQGVFGYRIVVVGNNGLASPRPQAGETPDIMVVVDNDRPEVRITGAKYGEGDRIGALVILYECSDVNLMTRPVALSFAATPEGPWTTIAAGLSNDGDYVWPADPQLPRQFYLRIDATDQAGNVGTFILDRPIDAQGLAPRARIRGFQSISGLETEASLR